MMEGTFTHCRLKFAVKRKSELPVPAVVGFKVSGAFNACVKKWVLGKKFCGLKISAASSEKN